MQPDRDSHSVENLVEHVRALPVAEQLEVLKRLAVEILPSLDEDDRSEFIEHLNNEVSRVIPPRIVSR